MNEVDGATKIAIQIPIQTDGVGGSARRGRVRERKGRKRVIVDVEFGNTADQFDSAPIAGARMERVFWNNAFVASVIAGEDEAGGDLPRFMIHARASGAEADVLARDGVFGHQTERTEVIVHLRRPAEM